MNKTLNLPHFQNLMKFSSNAVNSLLQPLCKALETSSLRFRVVGNLKDLKLLPRLPLREI